MRTVDGVVAMIAWNQSFVGCIMQIFGLLPDAIMALILKIALDTSEAGPFVA
jgi:hypothetical protein